MDWTFFRNSSEALGAAMFDPTEHNLDHDVEESMSLFERAKIGEIAPISPSHPKRLLLVLDGSSQDQLSVELCRRLQARFACPLDVLDAREGRSSNDDAQQIAESLAARACAKLAGDSYEQILAAVQQTGCDLVVVPSPYDRDLEKVGTDSTGTVIDVLLSRCPVPLLVVRQPYEVTDEPFSRTLLLLIAENEAALEAAGWMIGLTAPGGVIELLLVLENETVENFRKLMHAIDPKVEITSGQLSEALKRSFVRLHRALRKAAELDKLQYQFRVANDAEGPLAELSRVADHPLLVLALERADHASQGHVHDRIRRSPHTVLVVPRD